MHTLLLPAPHPETFALFCPMSPRLVPDFPATCARLSTYRLINPHGWWKLSGIIFNLPDLEQYFWSIKWAFMFLACKLKKTFAMPREQSVSLCNIILGKDVFFYIIHQPNNQIIVSLFKVQTWLAGKSPRSNQEIHLHSSWIFPASHVLLTLASDLLIFSSFKSLRGKTLAN